MNEAENQEFHVWLDRAQFFQTCRVLQRNWSGDYLGPVTFSVSDGKLSIISKRGGGELPCEGAVRVSARLRPQDFRRLVTANRREKQPSGRMKLTFRPALCQLAIDVAGVNASYVVYHEASPVNDGPQITPHNPSSDVNSAIHPELLLAWTIKGAAWIERGKRSYGPWAETMIREQGDAIRHHLPSLYRESLALLQKATFDPHGPEMQKLNGIVSGHDSLESKNSVEIVSENGESLRPKTQRLEWWRYVLLALFFASIPFIVPALAALAVFILRWTLSGSPDFDVFATVFLYLSKGFFIVLLISLPLVPLVLLFNFVQKGLAQAYRSASWFRRGVDLGRDLTFRVVAVVLCVIIGAFVVVLLHPVAVKFLVWLGMEKDYLAR